MPAITSPRLRLRSLASRDFDAHAGLRAGVTSKGEAEVPPHRFRVWRHAMGRE